MGNEASLPRVSSNKIIHRVSSKPRISQLGLKNNNGRYNSRNKTLLERMFEDLAKRSPNKTMSKDTFLEYFALPGILGERLFTVFDTKKDGVIHYDEFVNGLARYNEGTIEDKISMLFEMFDMDGQKQVSRNELSMILYTLITPTTSLFYSKNNGFKEDDNGTGIVVHKNLITRDSVSKLVNDAFKDCDTNKDDLLSFEQFTKWVKKNPNVLDVLEITLAKHMWCGVGHDNSDMHMNPMVNNGSYGNLISNDNYNGYSDSELIEEKKETPSNINVSAMSSSQMWNLSSPRKSMVPGFEDLYKALTEQYARDSQMNECTVAECDKCLLKYFKSLHNKQFNNNNNNNNNTNSNNIFTEYVFWRKNGSKNAEIKYCAQCGSKLKIRNIDVGVIRPSISLQDISMLAQPKNNGLGNNNISMEGDLWKLGRKTNTWVSRYYVVKDKFLYQFKNKKSEEPSSVLFISGWFFTSKDDEYKQKGFYGIELHPPHGGISNYQINGKMIYSKTKKERDDWVSKLQIAASTVAIQTHFKIGKVLGKGHFSVVHLGESKEDGKKYAIKVIEKSRIDAREKIALRNEIAIMKLVDHPCIIHMKDVYEDKKCIYMVMDLVPYGDFFERWSIRKRFDEKIAKIIIWKLLDAVNYLHSLGIVHRDLKPENMLCLSEDDDTQIVISDFGLSKFAAPHTEMTMPCGTLAYVAPEVLLLKKQIKGYDKKVDLWSIGCIMHLLLRGILPFDANEKSDIIEKTLNKKLIIDKNHEKWKNISNDAIDLLKQLLIKKPENRIDLNGALNHIWFKSLKTNDKLQITSPDKNIKAMVTPEESPLHSPKNIFKKPISVKSISNNNNQKQFFESKESEIESKIIKKEIQTDLSPIVIKENEEITMEIPKKETNPIKNEENQHK